MQRNKVIGMVMETKPDMLLGSPMFKSFSPCQRLNKAKGPSPERRAVERKVVRCLACVCTLNELQLEAGRLFLHERPKQGGSWGEPCIKRMVC